MGALLELYSTYPHTAGPYITGILLHPSGPCMCQAMEHRVKSLTVSETGMSAPSAQMAAWMSLDEGSMTYKPTVFFNDFWVLQSYLVPVNETVDALPIQLTLNSIGNMKFMLYVQMEQSFSMQVRQDTASAGSQESRADGGFPQGPYPTV